MNPSLIIVLVVTLGLAFPFLVGAAVYKTLVAKRSLKEPFEIDREALEGAEQTLEATTEQDWVILKRCHGPAYTHTAMVEILGALTAAGIVATYDVIASSSAEGGVTNFMLMVSPADEECALELLSKLEASGQ